MVPERHGGHDGSGMSDGSDDRSDDLGTTPDENGPMPDAPETAVIAVPDSWKTGVPEGTAGAEPAGPLRRLGVAPAAAALSRPADQRRLREHERERGLHEHERGAGPDDPQAGGGVG